MATELIRPVNYNLGRAYSSVGSWIWLVVSKGYQRPKENWTYYWDPPRVLGNGGKGAFISREQGDKGHIKGNKYNIREQGTYENEF